MISWEMVLKQCRGATSSELVNIYSAANVSPFLWHSEIVWKAPEYGGTLLLQENAVCTCLHT